MPHVTIVGGGMAGLAAAFWLLETDHRVTLLEQRPLVGGKLGGVWRGSVFHEVAYHFFADWCVNFWHLAGAIGLDRLKDFECFPGVTFLRPLKPDSPRAAPQRTKLEYLGSPAYALSNIHSGVLPWYEIVLYLHSALDLLADEGMRDDHEFLNRVSVNGYMRSLDCMTDGAALLHQEILLKAFSVPSFETSARAYRRFLELASAPLGEPVFRALRGPSYPALLHRLRSHLDAANGTRPGRRTSRFVCHTEARVERIVFDPISETVTGLGVRRHGTSTTLPVERLILAVPFQEAADLAERSPDLWRLVPQLRALRHLRSEQMGSLDLHFKRRLPNVPKGHVTLIDPELRFRERSKNSMASPYAISFIDNGQLWGERRTRLNVVSSEFRGLATLSRAQAQQELIDVLGRHLDFELADIDLERSYLLTNADRPLFINTVGSWEHRPEVTPGRQQGTVQRDVANLYLAGDYCRSPIDIPSVEGAIYTGIMAAHAASEGRVRPPRIIEPMLSRAEIEMLRSAMQPWLEAAQRAVELARSGQPPPPPPVLHPTPGRDGRRRSIAGRR
jgi:hypothetical protein